MGHPTTGVGQRSYCSDPRVFCHASRAPDTTTFPLVLLVEELWAPQQVGEHAAPGADRVVGVVGGARDVGPAGVGLALVDPLGGPGVGDDPREEVERARD